MPNIPVPVWEQLGVVIVFSFLLAGLGWTGLQAVMRVSQYLGADISAQKQVELIQRCLDERRALWQQIIEQLELMARADQEILQRLEQLRQTQAELAQALEARARRGKGSAKVTAKSTAKGVVKGAAHE